ncbi:MAG: hypothetical protein FWC65_06540 [Treponema sp.]|nr:hypothetical protein [Treponema sp.]
MKLFFALLILLIVVPLAAQEEALPEWDFGTLFYEPPPEPAAGQGDPEGEFSPMAMIRLPGFTVHATFEFILGLVPGWEFAPWFSPPPGGDRGFSWELAGDMRARFDIDTQISEFLRVRSALFFTFPDLDIELREFFFDYSLFHRVFFRGGRFRQSWGLSPNFAFTNLPARIPSPDHTGEPFILRADIPVGIGGFQFLALTRENFFDEDIQRRDIGYGGKFNLALRRADIDVGAFFMEQMPFRSFLSIKTTIGQTELYNEWMGVIDVNDSNNIGGAVNIGFARDFFRNRLTVNGEVFFNTEQDTYWYRPETNITEAEPVPFNHGFNLALNLIYRFRGRGDPRLFLQALYAPGENSGQLIPGFRLTPWEHLELYLAVPMAIGVSTGHYYHNPPDPRGSRPFAVVMLVTLRGGIRVGQ